MENKWNASPIKPSEEMTASLWSNSTQELYCFLRNGEESIISSTMSYAVWISSIPTAKSIAFAGAPPTSSQDRSVRVGRRRLPPDNVEYFIESRNFGRLLSSIISEMWFSISNRRSLEVFTVKDG